MAGRARCLTAHLVLMLVVAARCSAGQQPQHSGDPQEQLLALVSRAVAAATDPIVAELGSQRALLDSIVSRLEVQDTRLDALKARLDSQDATLNKLKMGQDALSARVKSSVVAALQALPRDCSDLPTGAGTGVYTLRPGRGGGGLADAYCDMDTDGGGWTVFQRRADLLPRQNFFLDWAEYREGFGNMTGEFWWGLQKLWFMSSPLDRRYELRVDLEDFNGEKKHAVYQNFGISSEEDGYRLTGGNYSGDAGDSLKRHFGKQFSTKDRDQDNWGAGQCAQNHQGAWWYGYCSQSSLNGVYLSGVTSSDPYRGVIWQTWRGYHYSLKTVEMKIRPTRHG